jgi:RNA-directed DNA polymerase
VKPEDTRPGRSSDPAPNGTAAHPAEAGSLWEQVLSRGNLAEALRRVEQNAGAPGIDGMSTEELRPWLHDHWSEVRSALDAGTYRPQPVRRVMIPKPSGGQRALGVPAAVDRLICQAIAQVLTPVFDPHFHPHSFGFRPGRSQHQAVERARQFIADGAAWCVDFDLGAAPLEGRAGAVNHPGCRGFWVVRADFLGPLAALEPRGCAARPWVSWGSRRSRARDRARQE